MVMTRLAAAGTLVALALSVTACAGSGSGKASTSTSETPSSAAPSSTAATASADATTTAAVEAAYRTFFGYRSTTTQVAAVLQHGSSFTQVIAAQASSSYAQKSSASVSAVHEVSADVATVVFSVASNGRTLLPGARGYAVRENGTWKVAAKTFCGLMLLQGTKAPACSNPSITALPTG